MRIPACQVCEVTLCPQLQWLGIWTYTSYRLPTAALYSIGKDGRYLILQQQGIEISKGAACSQWGTPQPLQRPESQFCFPFN